MTEQTVARYFWLLVMLTGLVVFCVWAADRPWLIGIVLIVVGGAFSILLWKQYFDAAAEARETERRQPESARQQPEV